jgi:hypothetical protein
MCSVVDQVILGKVFVEDFSFPYQFSLHQMLQTDLLSSEAGKMGPLVVGVPSGLIPNPRTDMFGKKRSSTGEVDGFDMSRIEPGVSGHIVSVVSKTVTFISGKTVHLITV